MIWQNAKNVPLSANPGTLPNVAEALFSWFQPLFFTYMDKKTVNFQLVETPTIFNFQGVRQPFSPQQLKMKPEGQRQWKWETVHAYPTLVLAPDDIITFANVNYRVMEKLDWKEYGYVEYHIVQDFEGLTSA